MKSSVAADHEKRQPEMITTSGEEEFETKWEVINANDGEVNSKASSSSTSSWWRLKDPRIVRVSRPFGGKDRHSKVCTARGLRDRRVRLSVPTAIQLYDLQHRLGLNQPSKVVDWLLDAAKHEIDELPPLQIQPENFTTINHHQQLLGTSQSNREGLSIDSCIDSDGSNFWNWDEPQRDGLGNFNAGGMPLPSTLSQVLVSPPGTAESYSFPSHVSTSVEFDPKQMNYFQTLLSSGSQNPLSNSPTPALYPIGQSNNNEELAPD